MCRVDTGLSTFFVFSPHTGQAGGVARASVSRFGSQWCKVRRSCRQRVPWRVYRRFSECHCNVRHLSVLPAFLLSVWREPRALWGFAAWRGIYKRGDIEVKRRKSCRPVMCHAVNTRASKVALDDLFPPSSVPFSSQSSWLRTTNGAIWSSHIE